MFQYLYSKAHFSEDMLEQNMFNTAFSMLISKNIMFSCILVSVKYILGLTCTNSNNSIEVNLDCYPIFKIIEVGFLIFLGRFLSLKIVAKRLLLL